MNNTISNNLKGNEWLALKTHWNLSGNTLTSITNTFLKKNELNSSSLDEALKIKVQENIQVSYIRNYNNFYYIVDVLFIATSENNSNFGDGVNGVFWKYITQKHIYNDMLHIHYITTGSILSFINNNSIIFGTGFVSKNDTLGGGDILSKVSKKYKTPYKVIAVRGPLSRQKMLDLNVPCPENYGDPLLLMPCLKDEQSNISENVVGIIPHYIDTNSENYKILKINLENNGYIVNYIDIRCGDNYNQLIDDINKCKYIISSSLHGVMMGIVYKKKTIHVEFSDKVIGDGFKFQDFFKSINITYTTINTYDIDIMKNIINVDYEYLKNVGTKLISLIPFIDSKRKGELSEKYINFYT